MIIVVEGVSAAGKTTWCDAQNIGAVVPERTPLLSGSTPESQHPSALVSHNTRRWREALELEAEVGIAVCDTDPFKLHYNWCELRAGLCTEARWIEGLTATRRAFANGELGFADAVIFLDPPESTLRLQREQDSNRTRRRFEKHLSFLPWLKEWYSAVDRLEPGRVHWGPGVDLSSIQTRRHRTGVEILDRFLIELAGPDSANKDDVPSFASRNRR